MKRFLPLVLITCLLLALGAQLSLAQDETQPSRADDPKEKEILARLEAVNPQAVPVFVEATQYWDAGELLDARQGFEAVLALAPDFPDALRRLSNVELRLNDLNGGLADAQRAFDVNPVPINEANLAYALLLQQDSAKSSEAFTHAQAGAQAAPEDAYILSIWLLTAGAVQDTSAMSQAAEQLLKVEPESALGYYYLGLADSEGGRWERAEKNLLRAKELGFPADSVQEVLDTGVTRQAQIHRLERYGLYAIGIGLIALLAFFGLRAVQRRAGRRREAQ